MSGFFGGAAVDVLDIRASLALNFILDAVDAGRDVIEVANGRVDEFESQSGGDVGASSGATYDATGDYYYNPSGDARIADGVPSSPVFGGTADNFNDDSAGTVFLTGGIGNLTGAPLANRLVGVIDLGSDKNVTKLEATDVDVGASGGDFQFCYATEAAPSTWNTFGTATTLTSPQEPSIVKTGSVAARYVAMSLAAINWGADAFECTRFNAYVPSVPALSLVSVAQTAAGVPVAGYGVALIELISGGAVNVDFGMDLSRDDGATWEPLMLSLFAALSPGNLYAGDLVFAGGAVTDMRWRVRASAGTAVKVHGVSDMWGA